MEQEEKHALYVIGYPKSGNVWMTRLVADALDSPSYGGLEKAKDVLGAEGHDRQGSHEIIRAHYSRLDKPPEITEDSKVIYVVRDLRDVVVSSFFHVYRIDERLVLLNEYCDGEVRGRKSWRGFVFVLEMNRLIDSCGPPISGGTSLIEFFTGIFKQSWRYRHFHRDVLKGRLFGESPRAYLAWSDHVSYWTSFSSNVAVVRYEDMLMAPCQTLASAFSKLGVSYDLTRLEEAIERQSFEKRRDAFQEAGDMKNIQHLRKGVAGDWKRFLDARMLQSIKEKHGRLMEKMGYEI